MRAARVVEVDDVEFGLYFIAVPMSAQMVVGNEREVGKLVVVNVHGEAFLDLLLDILIDYGVTFARAGSAQDHARPEGIDYIDPARTPLFTGIVAGGQIHGIFVLDKRVSCKKLSFSTLNGSSGGAPISSRPIQTPAVSRQM